MGQFLKWQGVPPSCIFCPLVILLALQPHETLRAQTSEPDSKSGALSFRQPVQVIIQTSTGQIVRGDLHQLDSNTVQVSQGGGYGNATSDLSWDQIRVMSLPTLGMRYGTNDDPTELLAKLAKHPDVESANPADIPDTTPLSPPDETPPTQTNPTHNENAVSPLDATSTTPTPSTSSARITIICENCSNEVSGNSDSGQTCPHCGILWDNNPFIPEVATTLPDNQYGNQFPADEGYGQAGFAPAQGARVQPQPVPGGNAPAAAPAPTPIQTAPQELTLANLPLAIKAAIFFVAIGVLYYFLFYVR